MRKRVKGKKNYNQVTFLFTKNIWKRYVNVCTKLKETKLKHFRSNDTHSVILNCFMHAIE